MTTATTTLSTHEIRSRIQAAQERIGRSLGLGLAPEPPPAATPIPAAVLVPLVLRPDGVTVLLTRRTEHLSAHAGQVSFPGGRIEPEDPDPLAAALRETEEEIGLTREHIEIIGRLDARIVRSKFDVTPFIGLVTPPFVLTPDEYEVAEIFEAPLAFVLDPANHHRRTHLPNGDARLHWALDYGGHYIWGATAAMLIELSQVLRG